MNEMKPEDVMRALEICAKPYAQNKVSKCKTCPYWERECHKEFIPDILALLREKDALIKHLDEDRIGWADEAVKVKMQLNEKDAEIERLKYNLSAVLEERADHTEAVAEAITEFAERLIAKKCHYTETEHTFDFDGVTVEDIDQIAKEMKG